MQIKFTDRFFKVPVELASKEESELVGFDNAEKRIVMERFNPLLIISYIPDPPTDKDKTDRTIIYLRGGFSITTNLSIQEFEKRLNDHYDKKINT